MTLHSTSRKMAESYNTKVNFDVKKDTPKVVDTVDIEEVGEKQVFCRCWRSKKVCKINSELKTYAKYFWMCANFFANIFLGNSQFYLQFPYCDGSHTKHNKETGDNVGPLIITCEATKAWSKCYNLTILFNLIY